VRESQKIDSEKLKKSCDVLLLFNNLVSTNIDENISFAFVDSDRDHSHLITILFQIKIHLLICENRFQLAKKLGWKTKCFFFYIL